MAIQFNESDTAIVRGIKAVGVGKKGSQPLDAQLIDEIDDSIRNTEVPPAALGAFHAGLMCKGFTQEEEKLKDVLGEVVPKDAPQNIRDVCTVLLNQDTLETKEAYELGQYLFQADSHDYIKGFVASLLRVRYETPDEYQGLLQAMQDTLEAPFQGNVSQGEPIIQMAEPFDGVDHTYMITPLIAHFLQSLNYRVVHSVGRNGGPKSDFNLADLANELGCDFVESNKDLEKNKSEFGWFFHQQKMSLAIDAWVDIRRQIVKRPFLATLERFLNPVKADILLVSAFHPPYGDKMMTIAERAGFKKIIVVRNGMEGGLGFPLMRSTKILCSKKKDDQYIREEIEIDPKGYLSQSFEKDEKLTHPSVKENKKLINEYVRDGKTLNRYFDARVELTCKGIKKAIEMVISSQ